MKPMNTFFLFKLSFVLVTSLMFVLVGNLQAKEPDWTNYGKLLSQHVKQGQRHGIPLMMVDYVGIKNDPLYGKVVGQIKGFNTDQLSGNNEKLAFYINAYNILAIKMVLDHWPVKSIKDAGSLFSSVWKKDVGQINHKTVTLNEVEHEVLRKLGEPRIHMAIVCASVSCPDLRDEPYTSMKLSVQLDDQTKKFLNNSGKGLRLKGNTAEVSKIFGWFEEDFEKRGGIAKFIKSYRKDLPKNIKIDSDISYDWDLNKN